MKKLIKPRNLNILFCILSFNLSLAYAATPIDVSHQTSPFINNLRNQQTTSGSQLEIISSGTDFNETSHLRFRQTYYGYTVWGAEVITHIPSSNDTYNLTVMKTSSIDIPQNAVLNGLVYEQLGDDLSSSAPDKTTRKILAEKLSISYLKSAHIEGHISKMKSETIVYVDSKTNKATWAFKITFAIQNSQGIITKPALIVDAQSQTIYQQWDQLERSQNEEFVAAGGYGGNQNSGMLTYDGTTSAFPSFTVARVYSYNPFDKDFRGNCYFRNNTIKIIESNYPKETIYSFPCHATDPNHQNLYWADTYESADGGFSPVNDVMYGLQIITQFYNDWYGLSVLPLDKHNNPKQLSVSIDYYHFIPTPPASFHNAYYNDDDNSLSLSTGGYGTYPFTSVGVMTHEISHAFTMQHSALRYYNDGTGAINEAFSDMAVQAIQYYLTGKNDWRIEKDIISNPMQAGCKEEQDCAMRYMDNPPKDGKSYDNVVQAIIYRPDNHYSSGVFNKMFYLLSSSPNWNTRMAFNVMVQANRFYWMNIDSSKAYKQIACGIIAAAKDYQVQDSNYDINSVIHALKSVGFKDDGLPSKYPPYDYDVKDCK